MDSTSTPADRLRDQYLEAIGERTDYSLGHAWAKAHGGKPETLMHRCRDWRAKLPQQLGSFAELMDTIGYRVEIVKKKERN